jgi:CRISPR-associated exonuclease Cas4
MAYSDDEMLMLSGIQHYMFCARQWALIHIEQKWEDNRLTTEGSLLHQNVDNPFYRSVNNGVITLRGVHVASHKLGLYGICDAIELLPHCVDKTSFITHPKYPGEWDPFPVEYKHGKPKVNPCDKVQLAAQAICLEELYGVDIPSGAIFYFETRHREQVLIDAELRQITINLAQEMHELYRKGVTPHAVLQPHCRRCSLYNICSPELSNCSSVSNYLKRNLYEETS